MADSLYNQLQTLVLDWSAVADRLATYPAMRSEVNRLRRCSRELAAILKEHPHVSESVGR